MLHKVSTKGIDIINITFAYPTHTCLSNACKHGIGGYNNEGLAWWYELPDHLIGKLSVNLLKFIAVEVTIHLIIRLARSGRKFTENPSKHV